MGRGERERGGGIVDTREWERKGEESTWWRGEKPAVYVRHSAAHALEGRGGVHNSLISMRVFSLEPLFCHEEKEEEEEVAACWLTPCAAALWATVLPVSRRPAVGGAVNSPFFLCSPLETGLHTESCKRMINKGHNNLSAQSKLPIH